MKLMKRYKEMNEIDKELAKSLSVHLVLATILLAIGEITVNHAIYAIGLGLGLSMVIQMITRMTKR